METTMKNGDYILVVAPDWYKGKRYRKRYCYEHHLVWEKETGCLVPDGYIIHHKDGNKYNNNINNLQLMSEKEHKSLHGKMQTKKIAIIKCPSCGKIFEKEARMLKFRTLVFCSRQCIGRYGYNTKNNKEELRKRVENAKKYNIIKIINKQSLVDSTMGSLHPPVKRKVVGSNPTRPAKILNLSNNFSAYSQQPTPDFERK